MSARILVVDDVAFNVKLLEIKLKQAYYDIITATNGKEALAKIKEQSPDLILMDVMMPDIDGFEATRRIKAQAEYAHIPVIMITALSAQDDKITGLLAGADDFLTKPINENALLLRVRSLLRAKFAADELRLREKSSCELGFTSSSVEAKFSISGSEVLLIDDDQEQVETIKSYLQDGEMFVDTAHDSEKALKKALSGNYSMIVISTQMLSVEGLRLCSQIRSNEQLRSIPMMVLVEEGDVIAIERALEMGINDYIVTPVSPQELLARSYTQIVKKKRNDVLRDNYLQSLCLSIIDPLTGLYNRRFLDANLNRMIEDSVGKQKDLTILIFDIDNFKQINDTYGHIQGDTVLKKAANLIKSRLRVADSCARYGGDEFVIVLPNTNLAGGELVAQNLLSLFNDTRFGDQEDIICSCSIGVCQFETGYSVDMLISKADACLYKAKVNGRNRWVSSPLE